MEEKKPVKLYFLVTVIFIIIVIHMGLLLKNFLSEESQDENPEETKEITKSSEPEGVQQSREIFGFASLIFFILVIIFLIFKLTTRQPNK